MVCVCKCRELQRVTSVAVKLARQNLNSLVLRAPSPLQCSALNSPKCTKYPFTTALIFLFFYWKERKNKLGWKQQAVYLVLQFPLDLSSAVWSWDGHPPRTVAPSHCCLHSHQQGSRILRPANPNAQQWSCRLCQLRSRKSSLSSL